MHCPECGFKLTLKDDFCPECHESFKGMDDSEKKRVFNRPLSASKVRGRVDSGNLNGYFVEEGRSIKGGKLRKGSSTSRGGSRPIGYDVNSVVRKEILSQIDKSTNNRPVKLDYLTKALLERDILGYDEDSNEH